MSRALSAALAWAAVARGAGAAALPSGGDEPGFVGGGSGDAAEWLQLLNTAW